MNASSILLAVVPVFFVLALGYAAGRYHEFDEHQTSGFNELALNFALPAALFLSMAGLRRGEILSSLPLLLVLLVSLTGLYFAAYLVARHAFGLGTPESALAALNLSRPAVLGGLFGSGSGTTVGLSVLMINLTQMPIALALLGSSGEGKVGPASLGRTLKRPLVWAPLLGLAVALAGVEVPAFASSSLNLIGQATSGVGIFAAGLILAAQSFRPNGLALGISALKVLAQPALVLGLLVLLGLGGQVAREEMVALALPTGTIAVQLAQRYERFVPESAAILVLTTVAMLAILPLAVFLTAFLEG